MRINRVDNVFQAYNKNTGVKKVKSGNMSKDLDQVKISEKAMEFQFAMQKIKEIPDVRREKVDTIKKQIESGTYEVDGKKIAEKILESLYFDKKI